MIDHGVARQRVGEGHRAGHDVLVVGLMRRQPLGAPDVDGDVDLLTGPAEVRVDVREDVPEVVDLLVSGKCRGGRCERHQRQHSTHAGRGGKAAHAKPLLPTLHRPDFGQHGTRHEAPPLWIARFSWSGIGAVNG